MSFDYSNNKAILARVKKKLRNYQVKGVEHGITFKHTLFDMYMGLGKTVCAWTVVFYFEPRRIHIICGRNALGTWIREVREWFPEYAIDAEFVIVPAVSKAERAKLWKKDATVFISTKETLLLDADICGIEKADVYIIDEVHKIPGHDTKTYIALELILRDVPIKVMLSGTWIKRHAGKGWRQLHMLSRKKFPSYWQFINKYCIVRDNGFGKEIVGPKNTEEFKNEIRPYVYRYHEKAGNVPESTRKQVWTNMTLEQAKIYDDLSKQMYSQLENDDLIISQVSMVTFTKHRQLLCCPRILNESLGLGAAFEGVLDILKEYEDDPEEQHCVIFAPFKAALQHYRAELEKRGYKTFVFEGGVSGLEIERRAMAFKAMKGYKSVALGTIGYAESYHLGTALRSHIIAPVWDADPMKQAEARLARADSDLSKTIVHRYWLYNETIDEVGVDIIRDRVTHVKLLFRHVDAVAALLKGKPNANPEA